MNILNLSLDKTVLNKNSDAAQRIIGYGKIVNKYTVIVLSPKNFLENLTANVKVYSSGGSNKIMRLANLYFKAKELLLKDHYDVITVQDQYFLAWLGHKLAGRHKAGLEIQVHGMEKFHGLRKMIAKRILPKAHAVRAVSQRLKRRLINDFKIAEGKITVAPIFSEPPANSVKQKSAGNEFIFLTASRLVEVKNIELQIRALAEVIKKHAVARLWIAGEGELRKKLEQLAGELGMNNYIHFLGWQDDMDKYYGQAQAFLLTSWSEGWGLAVIRAANFGLPIIMTDVGCAGEIIENNKSGIVIPLGDKEKLVSAMLEIIEQPDLREKLGEGAREAIKKLPSKQQTLDLYKKSWEKAKMSIK